MFDEVQVRNGRLKGELNSYFEGEGKKDYELEIPENFASEDHLLIRIRELKGPIMKAGEGREVALLPSLWWYRMKHREHGLVEAKLRKGDVETVEAGGKVYEAVRWNWEWEDFGKTVWVEREYPHRILRWEDSSGGSGELMETVREPYWNLKRNTDQVFREKLGIPR